MLDKQKAKKVLIILGSARKHSHTRTKRAEVFVKTEHTLLDLLDFNISPYNYSGNYNSTDNFIDLMEEFLLHDKIVFATPVYWYSMSGLMKTFMDRLTDLVTINKPIGRQLKGKETFFFAVGTDDLEPPGFTVPLELTSNYFGMNFIDSFYFSTKKINTEEDKESVKNFICKIKE